MSGDDDRPTPEVPPRIPDPGSMLTVRSLRQGVAELAAAEASLRRAYDREQRIRVICEDYWDSPAARQIVAILDERFSPAPRPADDARG